MEDKSLRRRIMQSVKGEDTSIELAVRKMVHSWGYRYSLHRADLPGKPDIVLVSRRKIIFVHGCFWHAHTCTRGRRIPQNNRDYWTSKIGRNAERDKLSIRSLRKAGWSVIVIWECELRNPDKLERRLLTFLRT